MGGTNLEIFKFGVYIMFPIAWMYYFGTNLDERFSVPDFWPKAEQTYKIPYEKSEIQGELDRLRRERLWRRQQRLIAEGYGEEETKGLLETQGPKSTVNGGNSAVGGPLDNSAQAAFDSLRNRTSVVGSWFGRS